MKLNDAYVLIRAETADPLQLLHAYSVVLNRHEAMGDSAKLGLIAEAVALLCRTAAADWHATRGNELQPWWGS